MDRHDSTIRPARAHAGHAEGRGTRPRATAASRAARTRTRPHGARRDEHQPRGPRPDRPADAAPAAGREPRPSTPWTPDARRRRDPALTALASLRRFVRPRAVREHCELCDAALADEHAHLVELATRRLVCACDACAILFSGQGRGAVPPRPPAGPVLPDFRLTDEAWEGLQLPINLAFFLHSTPAGRVVALYPSPAGATESLVAPEAWEALARRTRSCATSSPTSRGCWSTGSASRASTTASASTSVTGWSA